MGYCNQEWVLHMQKIATREERNKIQYTYEKLSDLLNLMFDK